MTQVQFTEARITYEDGNWLALKLEKGSVGAARRFLFGRVKGRYSAELKPYRARRSPDANRYFWTLCGKLAAAIGIPKDDIYREYVKQIGNNSYFKSVPPEEAERFKRIWNGGRLGWFCEEVGPSETPGEVELICYIGSSFYDTKQMSCLIDLVVQDCKDQGIETMTPDELQKMKARWKDAPDDKSV